MQQLHALSSALYQKFATITVLLSFVFSVKSDCMRVMGARPSLLCYTTAHLFVLVEFALKTH